jgi:hypothetical protein
MENKMNLVSDLEKLMSLRERGALSESEFEQAKALLLSGEYSKTNSSQSSGSDVFGPLTNERMLGLAVGCLLGSLIVVAVTGLELKTGLFSGLVGWMLVTICLFTYKTLKSQKSV